MLIPPCRSSGDRSIEARGRDKVKPAANMVSQRRLTEYDLAIVVENQKVGILGTACLR